MPDTDPTNLVLFFGRMHPLIVHLPIGFLIVLAVLEVVRWFKRWRGAAEARTVVLGLLVVSSILSVIFGLMLEEEGGYNQDLLFWHKWMGIGLAGGCIATALAFWSKSRWLYAGFLIITLALLVPSTHFGGSMTHGSDYLMAHAPRWIRDFARGPVTTQPTNSAVSLVSTSPPADPQQAVVFTSVVQPVLEKYCVGCHGGEKTKGELRLDTLEATFKGGESGPAIVPGNSKESPLIARLLLPIDDEEGEHMPPEGKPQPSPEQIALLKWWVDAGAPADKTVEQLDPPAEVMNLIAKALGAPAPAPTALEPAEARKIDPVPLDSLAGDIERLTKELNIVIEPVAMDLPWLAINASIRKPFGDEQLAQLEPLARNIQVLNLAGTDVTDAGAAVIAQMPNLQRLRLERTKVTDAGMSHLAKLDQLQYLNLYGTEITDAGLKPLQALPELQQIYLWRTKVDPAAAQAFADAMVDQAKIDQWKQQIAQLEAQIRAERVEVVQGVVATTQPTTAPAPDPAAPVVASATAPTTAAAVASREPVNTLCPVSGKPVDVTKFVDFQGQRVAFCCDNCPKEFEKDPAKYKDKIKSN
ncbi:MAG TPA: c-type cytochrome domain-containing protein [Tepidisphaeraceae bacterium]|nr:c-type cytochrome domain-containing protein [Tepidisphaeraceae bacterium]